MELNIHDEKSKKKVVVKATEGKPTPPSSDSHENKKLERLQKELTQINEAIAWRERNYTKDPAAWRKITIDKKKAAKIEIEQKIAHLQGGIAAQ